MLGPFGHSGKLPVRLEEHRRAGIMDGRDDATTALWRATARLIRRGSAVRPRDGYNVPAMPTPSADDVDASQRALVSPVAYILKVSFTAIALASLAFSVTIRVGASIGKEAWIPLGAPAFVASVLCALSCSKLLSRSTPLPLPRWIERGLSGVRVGTILFLVAGIVDAWITHLTEPSKGRHFVSALSELRYEMDWALAASALGATLALMSILRHRKRAN
jgi:hypothetical protein